VTIGNTLVATNRVAVGFNTLTHADVAGAFSSQGYNLIGALPSGVAGFTGATELTGTTALALDPRIPFSPAPNGFAVDSLRLLPGSPAVDKGRALGGATVDQRGLPRTVNLADGDFPNAAGGDGTDIGAFESQTLPNSQPTVSNGSFFTVTAGQALIGIAVFAFDEDSEPLTLSIVGTALPTGLTLNNDGSITGTTTVVGSATYQFKANDGKEDSEVASFTLLVNETPSLVVNTLDDAISNIDGVTSLREAVTLAQTDAQITPVTFDPTVFATRQSTAVPFSPISITSDVEIIGPAAGVSLTSTSLSISGGTVALSNLTFQGQINVPFIDVSGTTTLTATGCTFGVGQFFASSLPLVNNGGTVTLRNCTVAGNDVTNSGSTASALFQVTGTLLLQNCTIAANIGPNTIEIAGGTFSTGNTLVAGNSLAAAGAVANQIKGAVTSLGYNLIGAAPDMTLTGTTTGNQLNVANALLDPNGLRLNGGPTPTVALLLGSPAIDKGLVQGGVTVDQRGRARLFDNPIISNAGGGDGSDIGAFEVGDRAADFFAAAPVLITPKSNGGLYPTASVTFSLPGPANAGSVKLRFQLQDPPYTGYEFDFPTIVAAGLHTVTVDTVARGMGPGPYFVTLDYQDEISQVGSTLMAGVTIRPASARTTLQLASKSPVPQAGVLLPAGATVTSFNLPAIDDAGNITYLARWSATTPRASGTALFLNDQCPAFIGGTSPITGGSKYTAFTDPVIDDGQLVCIASLAGGTPKPPARIVATAFASQSPPSLTSIAGLGQVAPNAAGTSEVGGPVFKTFRAVDVHQGVIGIFAQVSGGTGTLRTTAANDVGLWIQSSAQPLTQALREGQQIGSKTVGTIVSFVSGALSGGQGRGWVTKPVGTNGAVLALVTFTDRTQAIVSAEANGVATVFSAAGALGTAGGPSLPDASFATYGFPAANDNDTSTFLATLRSGLAGVTSSTARGLFQSHPDGSYTTLARIGLPSSVMGGATFSLLRDPVLSSDDGVAFLATLRGGTAKGLNTSTLWWQPPGGAIRVHAQGGAEAADVPGSEWRAFSNLAIAGGDRGPVFAASLVTGKGGVTASNDTGVWATDFIGRPRLLFREGDTIDGKRLTAFNLLRSTTGNVGVTRSLNDRFRIAWIATFSDKSTALMTTEMP
jgi:hypothetical protein